MLVAPPGYGKTVLLAEVAETLARPLLWLQLDEGDNDPVAFVTALAEGARRGFPALTERLDALDLTDAGGREERLLAVVVNAFADALLDDWTLVLDDLHLVANPRVLALVARLVEFPPPGMALLVASRTRPALPLNRWLARGVVKLVDVDDLRFTQPEAEAWLRRDLPGLDAAVVARLVERTEGWGAGLYLAGGLLSGGTDAAALAERLSGSNPAVGGYLMDEVFERQSPELRRFLLSSAVLPQFDAASCARMLGLGATESERCIELLTREQTFLQPLDADGRWYRYHPLFREFLLERLIRHDGDLAARLRLAAGRAAEEQGDLASAVGFYLDAGARPQAARLLQERGTAMLAQGRGEALHRWLLRLGEELEAAPELRLLLGRVLRRRGKLHEASAVLRRVGETRAAPTAGAALTELAIIARSQGDYRRGAEWARQAVAAAGAGAAATEARAVALMELARCRCHAEGMLVGRQVAEEAVEELASATQPGVDRRLRATMLGSLGQICWWQGDVAAAVGYLEEALADLDDVGGLRATDGLHAAEVRLALASPTLYTHDHRAARRHAEQALATFQRHEAKERIPAAYAVLGNVYTRAGELDRAEALLRSAIALADEIDGASYDRVMAAGYLAHVLELQGRLAESAQVASEALWAFDGGPVGYEVYVCRSVLADTHLSAGRLDEAKRIYEELAEIGEERQYRIPLALVYFGLAYIALERGESAGVVLAERAFDMLAPSHAWRLVVDQGLRAERVLAAVSPERPFDPFVERVTAALGRRRVEDGTASAHVAGGEAGHADVEVQLLGELRVLVNGESLSARAFTSGKARDLLAYLVARRDETVTLEGALADLWPDEPARAKTALHTALYRLRKALQRGPDDTTRFVLVEAGRYRLDTARFDVDVDRFESLTSQAREAAVPRQIDLLSQAVGMVRGEILAGFDYAWVAPLRMRLTESVANALHRLGELLLATGQAQEARGVAVRYTQLDPLDERAHLLFMRAQKALGDLVGVEQTHRRLVELLRSELGVQPTAETERQYRDLLGRS